MTYKYKKFLEKCEIISEDNFNKIIESLPEFDDDNITYDLYSIDSFEEISEIIINSILRDWDCVYAINVDFEEKRFELWDVQSLEDLEEIVKKFSKWTISNYSELKKDLEEEQKIKCEESENTKKLSLIKSVINNIPLEDLKTFISKYDKQKFSLK